ncbi:unnamed protein product [Lactuca virosa]|uniref:Uncharacterized protein n=1 Tax=Lactuca virosa TaxID=75947 RepID=A0AAU9MTM6_9ASTR|nr:unnamed protein product [Lactuca virosa]
MALFDGPVLDNVDMATRLSSVVLSWKSRSSKELVAQKDLDYTQHKHSSLYYVLNYVLKATTIAAFARMTVEDSKKLLLPEFYPSWVIFSQRQKLSDTFLPYILPTFVLSLHFLSIFFRD